MKNKKILIIINNFGVGGAERLVIDDANELSRRDTIDFKIITLKKEGKDSLLEQLNNKVKFECIDFGSLYDVKSWFLLYKNIKDFNPDIMFTHLWYSNTIGRISGKLANVSNIVSFEHNIYDTLKNFKMFTIDWVLQIFSSKIIAVSEAVKKSLIKHKIKKSKIEVILNGIDVSKYQNLNVISLDGEEKKDFVFVFIGRLIHQKGIDILLKAFALVKKGKLLIVGDGIDKEKLIILAKELNIEKRVKFLGIRKDIPEILSYSDCFVMPSRYEGLGMVLIEAIVSNKVVIISDFDAGREIVKDGKNGYVFPINDYLILSKKMIEFMDQKNNVFIENNKVIVEMFSIVKHVDKLQVL